MCAPNLVYLITAPSYVSGVVNNVVICMFTAFRYHYLSYFFATFALTVFYLMPAVFDSAHC